MGELHVRGCTVSYGEAEPALVDVDLTVPSGSLHALLGPSGSGKTTLLRAIAGFLQPTRGSIELGGRSLVGVDPAKRGIGVVFQSYALFPHLDVLSNVGFGLEVRKVPREERRDRIRDVLDLVGLRGYETRRPAQLSGGQQQRVALARALVIQPDLLLLDEPLSALDRKIRSEVQRELKRIHETTGVTAVIVTHDQEEALFLSGELTILDAGRVRQVGRPTQVYDRPADPFIADFLGSMNLLEAPMLRSGDAFTADFLGMRVPVDVASAGDTVTLGLRPERIRVHDERSDDALSAVVEAVDFAGPLASLTCRLEDDREIMVTTWGREAPRYRPGQKVWLEPEPGAIQVFEENAHAADG